MIAAIEDGVPLLVEARETIAVKSLPSVTPSKIQATH